MAHHFNLLKANTLQEWLIREEEHNRMLDEARSHWDLEPNEIAECEAEYDHTTNIDYRGETADEIADLDREAREEYEAIFGRYENDPNYAGPDDDFIVLF